MKNLNRIKSLKAKSQGGFTLIELVMVIVVIGILAAVALPKFVDVSGAANHTAAKASVSTAQTAFSAALMVNADTNPSDPYPTVSQLIAGVAPGKAAADNSGVCVGAQLRADTFTDAAGTIATTALTDKVMSVAPTGIATADPSC